MSNLDENAFIRSLSRIHGISAYSADAEIVERSASPGTFELFSVDSFSEEEDFFSFTPPERIGHNIAAGVCSDLLACAVRPRYLLQSWNPDATHDSAYYQSIAEGIERVLRHYGARCIGGDTGTAAAWQYCATVIGESETPPVRRIASKRVPFRLFLSGFAGRANLAAFLNESMPEIPLRAPVPSAALFATDSSGGFFDAVENFRRVNRGVTLELDLSSALAPELQRPALFGGGAAMHLDPLLCLIGGVGEYELLYALENTPAALALAPDDAIPVGEGAFGEESERNEIRLYRDGRMFGRMTEGPPDYRKIAVSERISETLAYLERLRV